MMAGYYTELVQSPAKINLYLHVTGKRSDGYHDLETLFCAVGIYDTMRFTFGTEGLAVFCDRVDVPDGEGNIAYKAALAFQDATGIPACLHIEIEKRIPPGGGLGGGSGNAAQVLRVMNRHCGFPLSETQLREIARQLGADVPFFLYGKPAFAMGVGEVLTPCTDLVSYAVLLVNPGIPVSTRAVFENFNFALTKEKKAHNYPALKKGPVDPKLLLHNDLEPTAAGMLPAVREVRVELESLGADGVLMSGSGPTFFALFSDVQKRDQGYQLILHRGLDWQVFSAEMIL